MIGFVAVLWLGVIIWSSKGIWSLFRHGDLLIAGVYFLLAGVSFFVWYKLHNWALRHPKESVNIENQKNSGSGGDSASSMKNEIESFVEHYILGASVATQKHLLEDGILQKSKSWLAYDELLYYFLHYAAMLCCENSDKSETADKAIQVLVFVTAEKYWKYFQEMVEESSAEQLYNRIQERFVQRAEQYYNYHEEYLKKVSGKSMAERYCFNLEKLMDLRSIEYHMKIVVYISTAMKMMRSQEFWTKFPPKE